MLSTSIERPRQSPSNTPSSGTRLSAIVYCTGISEAREPALGVASSIIYFHMALAKYCYHNLKDKLVICASIGLSFHKPFFHILFGVMKDHLVSLEVSVPSPIDFNDEDQHLALGGCLRGKQAISMDHLWF